MLVEAVAGTSAWVAARRGCLTASRMNDAAAFLKNGKPAEARTKLLFELASERLTGIKTDHFVTAAMQHGIDQQPNAIAAYEALSGELVGPELFVLHPEIEGFGATPDGLVGADGLTEVKCPTTAKFLTWVRGGTVPEEHRLQMLAQLACTRRHFVDFVAYDPRVPEHMQLFVRRFEPTKQEIESAEQIARDFLQDLETLIEEFNEDNYGR